MVSAPKDFNRSIILNLIRRESGISRTVVAQRAGLSKATISSIVEGLISEGLIVETGKASAAAGRRPVMLGINPEAQLALGIEVGTESCQGVLTDLGIHPIRATTHRLPDTSVTTVLDAITQIAEELLDGYDRQILIGAGIGVPGIYDEEAGRVTLAEHLGWSDVPLHALAEERLGMPVVVVNRTNAAALGERSYGAGSGVDNLFYMRIGSGIGGGVILDGKLYAGVTGAAGEIGHTIVEPRGQPCSCGGRGCLETVATTGAIAARAQQKLRRGRTSMLLDTLDGQIDQLTWGHVIDGAHAGDTVAVEVIREAGEYLGVAAANIVTLFNPAQIIIGGPLARAGQHLLDAIRSRILEMAFAPSIAAVEVVNSVLGERAVSIGAAAIFVDNFFEAPLQLAI